MMALGTLDDKADSAPMAEINMIPLIDVMLVLLVIFIITAPLLTHSVRIDLPKASSAPTLMQPDTIQLALKAGGELYWNGERIDARAFQARIVEAVKFKPQSELH